MQSKGGRRRKGENDSSSIRRHGMVQSSCEGTEGWIGTKRGWDGEGRTWERERGYSEKAERGGRSASSSFVYKCSFYLETTLYYIC